MNFLGSIVSSLSPDLSAQVAEVKSEAQTLAQVVAAWGFVVVVELGILIFIIARKRRTA